MTVAGPFTEAHLADQLRLKPGATSHFCDRQPAAPAGTGFLRQICERTIASDEPPELLVQRFQHALVEAGSHFGSKLQFAAVVITHEDRAKVRARAFRRRETANDEFLFVRPFELLPRTAAPADFVE